MVEHMKARIFYLELLRILPLHAVFSVKTIEALNSSASGFWNWVCKRTLLRSKPYGNLDSHECISIMILS